MQAVRNHAVVQHRPASRPVPIRNGGVAFVKCTRFSKKIPRLRRLASWSVTSPDVGATTGRPLALAKSNLTLTSKTSVKAKAPLCKGSCRVATEGLFYVGFRTALFSETVRLTIPQSPSVTAPFTQGSLGLNRCFACINEVTLSRQGGNSEAFCR